MAERKLTVMNESGLHLRPAQQLCTIAMGYECRVMICFRNREYNAKSLLGVLSACVSQGDEITLVCTGRDEEAALKHLADFIMGAEHSC